MTIRCQSRSVCWSDSWCWLHGELDKKYIHTKIKIVIDLARQYFPGYKGDEIREYWFEFELMLIEYINKNAITDKKYYITHPFILVIISKPSLLWDLGDSFRVFFEKLKRIWVSKSQKTKHPLKLNIPINLDDVLGALYILKCASIEEMDAVISMHEFLFNKQCNDSRHESKLLIVGVVGVEGKKLAKEAVKRNAIRAAQADRQQPLSKYIDKILEEEPSARGRDNSPIIRRFKNQTESDRQICQIELVIPRKRGSICYTADAMEMIVESPWDNVKKLIAKRKTIFKKKKTLLIKK